MEKRIEKMIAVPNLIGPMVMKFQPRQRASMCPNQNPTHEKITNTMSFLELPPKTKRTRQAGMIAIKHPKKTAAKVTWPLPIDMV